MIRPDSQERQDIGLATECIACGCCVSSCTMCHYHEGLRRPRGPEPRLHPAGRQPRRTVSADGSTARWSPATTAGPNSTARRFAPKISAERAPSSTSSAWRSSTLRHEPEPAKIVVPEAPPLLAPAVDRRTFLTQMGVGVLGVGSALVLGAVATGTAVGPALSKTPKQWVPVAPWSNIQARRRHHRADEVRNQERLLHRSRSPCPSWSRAPETRSSALTLPARTWAAS